MGQHECERWSGVVCCFLILSGLVFFFLVFVQRRKECGSREGRSKSFFDVVDVFCCSVLLGCDGVFCRSFALVGNHSFVVFCACAIHQHVISKVVQVCTCWQSFIRCVLCLYNSSTCDFSPHISAIIATRGGNGAARMLHLLNFTLVFCSELFSIFVLLLWSRRKHHTRVNDLLFTLFQVFISCRFSVFIVAFWLLHF